MSKITSFLLFKIKFTSVPGVTPSSSAIGLYRGNAIAIQDESGDSNGGNV